MKKRFLSVLMALCLCLTLLPAAALADTGSATIELTRGVLNDPAYQYSGKFSTYHYLPSGAYTLAEDIELDALGIGNDGEEATVVLDLNGHKLTQTTGNSLAFLRIYYRSTLTLTDSSAGKSGEIRSLGSVGAVWFANFAKLNANGGSVYGRILLDSEDAEIQRDPALAGVTSFYGEVIGWNTSAKISGGVFFGGITSSVAISDPQYTVTFSAGGTEPFAKALVVGDNTKLALPKNVPTKNCHTFDGWYTDESCTAAFDFENTVITRDITLYAKWKYVGHSGGEADCTHKAICEVCGEEYGEVNAANHAALKHIEAKAATTEAEGHTEYWRCEDCGKYFSDEDCANEITLADTVIAKLVDATLPQTGDSSRMALWLAILLVSGGALAGMAAYDKRKTRSAR